MCCQLYLNALLTEFSSGAPVVPEADSAEVTTNLMATWSTAERKSPERSRDASPRGMPPALVGGRVGGRGKDLGTWAGVSAGGVRIWVVVRACGRAGTRLLSFKG